MAAASATVLDFLRSSGALVTKDKLGRTVYHYHFAECSYMNSQVMPPDCYDDIAPDTEGYAADCMEPGYYMDDTGMRTSYVPLCVVYVYKF